MNKLTFLKAYFSPFKALKPRLYVGKTAIGTPYFYPRRWVKATPELASQAAMEDIKRFEKWNQRVTDSKRTIPAYCELYKEKLRCLYPKDKQLGFDFVGLGWKTKWSAEDIRFEWSPIWSFVFFGYQIAVIWDAPEQDHYWECWLYYELYTDKTKSKAERIAQCREKFPQIWSNNETKIDYYNLILRKKYLQNG